MCGLDSMQALVYVYCMVLMGASDLSFLCSENGGRACKIPIAIIQSISLLPAYIYNDFSMSRLKPFSIIYSIATSQ